MKREKLENQDQKVTKVKLVTKDHTDQLESQEKKVTKVTREIPETKDTKVSKA